MTFTNVFGNTTLPPAEFGYNAVTLSQTTQFFWPYNTSDTPYTMAKIMDVTANSQFDGIILPNATQVSVGEDFLVRNVGAEDVAVVNQSFVQVAIVPPGAATYFYLVDNTTVDGVYGVIAFGVGTSTVDASSLVGYGIKAIGASLNQSHPTVTLASGTLVDNTSRASLLVFTGGSDTLSLSPVVTLGNDFFFLLRNNGTGTLTISPNGAETIDGMLSLQLQPSESVLVFCTGVEWFTVGIGRSVIYQFTQLVKDVSAGGTITLTAAEASNKLLTFVGNPASAVTVVVPQVVAVYYTFNNLSTSTDVILKTSAGAGMIIPHGARIIGICDGTNVYSAQSAVANSSVSLADGSVTTPSLFFATQTNTGVYKFGTSGFGITVEGSPSVGFGPLLTAFFDPVSMSDLLVTGAFSLTGDVVQISEGGTGAGTAPVALANLGAAPINSPTFTGDPKAPTPAHGDNDTSIATTAFAVAGFVAKTSTTGAAAMPVGPTAGRPVPPEEGFFRRNSQLQQWEGYDGSNWTGLGGASGGGGNPFVYENDIHVTTNYTITANKNGMSAGPIIIDNGVTVTVPPGSVWTVV